MEYVLCSFRIRLPRNLQSFRYGNACLSCALLRALLSKSRFIMKVLFTFLHLSSPNLLENNHNFVFLTIKYELSNSLSHVCFEKIPRN